MSFDEFLRLGINEPRYQAEVQRRVNDAKDSDVANILYTSGTTGQSKGVILLHSQYRFALEAHTKVFTITPDDVVTQFPPLQSRV